MVLSHQNLSFSGDYRGALRLSREGGHIGGEPPGLQAGCAEQDQLLREEEGRAPQARRRGQQGGLVALSEAGGEAEE